MMNQPLLVLLAVACAAAAVVWGRSTLRLHRAWRRTISAAADAAEADKPDVAASERAAADLARSAFRKELHTTIFYGVAAELAFACSFATNGVWNLPFVLLAVPIGITFRYGPRFLAEAHLAEERSLLVRKAERALEQELEAPRRWASRL